MSPVEEGCSAAQDVGVRLPDVVQEDPVEGELRHVQRPELGEPQPGVSPGLAQVAGQHQQLLVLQHRTQRRHRHVHIHLVSTIIS